MISKKFRFHGHGSVNRVYRQGRSLRVSCLSAKYYQTRRENPRFTVVVSKKVAKSAVIRNRIRRRIYEKIRLQIPSEAVDVVITVFDTSILAMTDRQLTNLVSSLLQKIYINHNT